MFRVQSFHSPYAGLQLPSKYDRAEILATTQELHNRAEGELELQLHLPAPQVPARDIEIANALSWLTEHMQART